MPVGAIESRWLLRIPRLPIWSLFFSGSRGANRDATRYSSFSNNGKALFSVAISLDARKPRHA